MDIKGILRWLVDRSQSALLILLGATAGVGFILGFAPQASGLVTALPVTVDFSNPIGAIALVFGVVVGIVLDEQLRKFGGSKLELKSYIK